MPPVEPAGRYEVLGELGRGGVGVVYKTRDRELGREVAMKVIRDEYARHPQVRARFVEEARICGQLQHPGVVPVYELGAQADQRPYFAMKLVEGETLAAQLSRRAFPAQDRRRFLGIFEQICQTLAYVHSREVVHRDLKPENVMIGAFGEVQIVDWGFAKILSGHGLRGVTGPDSLVEAVRSGLSPDSDLAPVGGTPGYMSPEQARGDPEHLDARSDVFGLGAILCEILTGEPPYVERDGDLLEQAARGDLGGAYARLRGCGADGGLVHIAVECLDAARRARPASAAEVAARVGTYLTSVEERARQAELNAAEARYRQQTTLLAVVGGVVLAILGVCAWLGTGKTERVLPSEVSSEGAATRRRQRDGAMLARLADLGIPTPGVDRAARARRLDEAYAGAFAAYLGGGWLLERSPEAALFALRRGGITHELAAALDLWALARDTLPVSSGEARADTVRLRLLAGLLDPDEPARACLRKLLPTAIDGGADLRVFAAEADPGALGAPGCRVLSEALALAGEDAAAVEFLRRAREAHPRDFQLTLALAFALEQLEEPRWQEAFQLHRLAHSLRAARAHAVPSDGRAPANGAGAAALARPAGD